jgi:hypothetical protein
MEVDNINHIINNIASQERDADDDSSESEDSDDFDQSENNEDEVNAVQRPKASTSKSVSAPDYEEALYTLINALSIEKRQVINNGDCFWCKKQGHRYSNCPDRKKYMAKYGIRQTSRTRPPKGKSNKRKKPQRPLNNKNRKFQKRDPNSMVYNLLEQFDMGEESDGNF